MNSTLAVPAAQGITSLEHFIVAIDLTKHCEFSCNTDGPWPITHGKRPID